MNAPVPEHRVHRARLILSNNWFTMDGPNAAEFYGAALTVRRFYKGNGIVRKEKRFMRDIYAKVNVK